MRPYNPDVVLDLINGELDRRGRGAQTRLAEALGVRVQTVNKWRSRQTTPEPAKWPAIEAHFGLPLGTLRKAVGWDATVVDLDLDPDGNPRIVSVQTDDPVIAALDADRDIPQDVKQAIITLLKPYKGQ